MSSCKNVHYFVALSIFNLSLPKQNSYAMFVNQNGARTIKLFMVLIYAVELQACKFVYIGLIFDGNARSIFF